MLKYLALLMILLAPSSQAAELEVGIGHAIYSMPDNGVWYQNGFDHQFDRTPRTKSIGITGYLTSSTRYHLGYLDLGGVSSSALAVADDKNYNGVNGCVGRCLPLSNWYGVSSLTGWYATVAPEHRFGRVKAFVELGAWYYTPEFTMDIPNWTPCVTCIPSHKTVHYDGGSRVGSVFGVGVEYHNTQLTIQSLDTHAGAEFPPNFGARTVNVMLQYHF